MVKNLETVVPKASKISVSKTSRSLINFFRQYSNLLPTLLAYFSMKVSGLMMVVL